jgi:hypothetical protein
MAVSSFGFLLTHSSVVDPARFRSLAMDYSTLPTRFKSLRTRTPTVAVVPASSSETEAATTTTAPKNSTSPFAYAFVIGGCDPDNESSYQNYLFNILIGAKILKERGSTADVVALFQVSSKAMRTRLPDKDSRLLHALGVYVYYIPQQAAGIESFYRTQLDKFRILGLTQYKRILFLDGDVMPLANLDYLFDFSANGIIQENLVVQGIYEPANGGFFMLEPGHLQQANDIVQWREQTGKQSPYPYFDAVVGWGHTLAVDDPWRSRGETGTNWTFLAAFADQGLLYYYTKYARQSVSIVLRNGTVENWALSNDPDNSTSANGTIVRTVQLQSALVSPFDEAVKTSNRVILRGKHNMDGAPFHSFIHFTGTRKPWLSPPVESKNATLLELNCMASDTNYWFWKLMELDKEFNIGLNFSSHWSTGEQRPPLGMYPVYAQILNATSNLLTPLERDVRRVLPKIWLLPQ